MKKIIILALLLPQFIWAQQKEKKCAIAFQSINQVGMLKGEHWGAFQLQSINGIRYKTYSVGVGVGIDEYRLRSIPLFLDLRKEWKTGRTPFVYADGGVHFTWPDQKDEWTDYDKTGMFYDLGIGYRLPLNGASLLLSAGYSFKSYSLSQPVYSPWLWLVETGNQQQMLDYKLRRISIKMGISF